MQLTQNQRISIDCFLNDLSIGPAARSELKGLLLQIQDEANKAPEQPPATNGKMFTVEIVEHIVERRLYEIGPCENGLEAAREARSAYIDNGVSPDDGPSISVEEREFQVTPSGGSGTVTFDESEVIYE